MPVLSPQARKTLLGLARRSIETALSGSSSVPPAEADTPELGLEAGAFVTLHKEGALRGCIGTFSARDRLDHTVGQMARAAAFEDPRFPPLSPDELPLLDLEISVLSPMQRVEDVEQIEVGRHGLCIAQGHRQGVLLPQVAAEHGWDRETFLAQTCRKAGLQLDAWRQGAEIYSFEAQVFGEKDQCSLRDKDL